MPYHKMTYKFGNLFVIFKVTFPESLSADQMSKVGLALAHQKKKGDVEMDIAETGTLKDFEEGHRNVHHEGGQGGGGSDGEEEEDDGRGGQKVRCQQ
jgi:hypothetical protein